MIYTIENDLLRVEVSDVGAELMSVKTKKDDCEYLWQGDATYWAGRACNLFPICGRLFEGKYTYQGKTYEMNLHGFIRHMTTRLVDQTANAISFTLTDTPDTLLQYPFHFAITITYTLEGNTIHHTFTVENPDAANTLIFSLGGHPGFNVPLTAGESFEDYYVQFDTDRQPQKVVMSDACLDTGRREPFLLEEGNRLSLRHNLFDNDAIFLTYMSEGVTLRSEKSDKFVHLSYPDMSALGLWHKPQSDAPYVCIEPWYSLPAYDGVTDALETKQLMIHLAPGKVYKNTFDITVG